MACLKVRLLQPSSMVQLSQKNPDRFIHRALRIVKTGFGQPSIFNTEAIVQELMRQGKTPQEACKIAVERIISKHTDMTGLQCGFLAMDMFGRVGSYSVYSGFNYAIQKEDGKNEMINSDFDRGW